MTRLERGSELSDDLQDRIRESEMNSGDWRGSSGRQTRHTSCGFLLHFHTSSLSKQSEATTRMKKGLKKAKAKVGQLFSDSRSRSHSQAPVPLDPDLGPLQSALILSDTVQDQVQQQVLPVIRVDLPPSINSHQIVVTPAPTPSDSGQIPPTCVSDTHTDIQGQHPGPASAAMAHVPDQTPVRMPCIRHITSS